MNPSLYGLRAIISCSWRKNGGAVSADITSANTVGYVTAEVPFGNYRTFSVTLADVTKPTSPIAIDKLFTVTNLKTAPAFGDGMDQIWRWDTTVNAWAKYGYQKPARTGTAAWRKWTYDAATPAFAELTDEDVIRPGETFLYFHGCSTDSAVLTLAGQVKELGVEGTYAIPFGNYQFIAYPWPVQIKLSAIDSLATITNLKTAPAFGDGMDQIWRWDTTVNAWAKYGYQKPARTGTAAWRKWTYDAATPAFVELTDADTIAAGEGFLYFHGCSTDPATVTFKPLQSAE